MDERRRTRDDGRQTVTHRLSSIVHRPHLAVRRPRILCAPVGHAAAHRAPVRARPSATGRSKGIAATVGKPRPSNVIPGRSLSCSAIRTHSPQRMHFPDSYTISGCEASRAKARRAPLYFPGSAAYSVPVPPKPAGVPRQAIALNASPRFADGFGVGEPGGDLVEHRPPPGTSERRLGAPFAANEIAEERGMFRSDNFPISTCSVLCSPTIGSPRRNWPMESAASRPAATARTAAPGLETHSPPAKTPSRFVASVCRSAAMPRAVTFTPSLLKNSVSARRCGAAINRPASTRMSRRLARTSRAPPRRREVRFSRASRSIPA